VYLKCEFKTKENYKNSTPEKKKKKNTFKYLRTTKDTNVEY
jgi:hypothetical protein